MSGTALRSKTADLTKARIHWPSTFPKEATATYSSSLLFMKQLTLVAVSTITYVKDMVPEECYSVDLLAGAKMRILNTKCDNELGSFLYDVLNRAYEALDKKYLKQIVLCFYDEECKQENLLEFHTFDYTYGDGGASMAVTSKCGNNFTSYKSDMEDVKKRTVMLIRNCTVTVETFPKLPDNYDVSVRLYYNDDAPDGYQVPGFRSASHLPHPSKAAHLEGSRLGAVGTGHHQLVMHAFTRDTHAASHEAQASQNAPEMTPSQLANDDDCTSATSPPTPAAPTSCRSSRYGDGELRCVCPAQTAFPMTQHDALLLCYYCNTRQHAVCYGVLRRVSRVARHCCAPCADRDAQRTPTDPRLQATHKRESLAIFRCSLKLCEGVRSLCVRDLSTRLNLNEFSADRLMQLLSTNGVVGPRSKGDDPTVQLKINHDKLGEVMKIHFISFEDDDLVERLVEETLASQTQPDPVGEVLGPLKQISLANATNIGRVILSQEINNNCVSADDATMKMYKEALVVVDRLDVDADMPLSGSHNPVQNLEKLGKKRKNDENSKVGVAVKRVKSVSKGRK